MTTQVFEGTWEEITRHSKELIGRKVRLLVLEDDTGATPNRKAVDILNDVRSKQKDLRFTNGEEGIDIVRRGRSGDMFQNDPELVLLMLSS
ncbi:MAG TPA: hypothetical protein PLK77_05545 [Pyrinomonadaceae bacterium]|nr:hypothetical protein [Pyrinomonadaceae bacterium]